MYVKRKYINGQVWRAEWPKCWKMFIMYIRKDKYMAVSLYGHADGDHLTAPGPFHRDYNGKTPYLFTEKTLDKLLGKKAELLNEKVNFISGG